MNAARLIQRAGIVLSTGLGLLVLLFVLTKDAGGTAQPTSPVPGYPREGCYSVLTAGTGMWDGVGQITIQVPGPVVNAYLWWAGAFRTGGLTLTVNGESVTGEQLASLPDPEWFLWRANLGPGGHDLVHQGSNTLTISGWEGTGDLVGRNGATLTVVYATQESPCLHPVELQLHEYLDYMYRNFFVSDVQVYPIVPAPFVRTLKATISFAGTDAHPVACREFRVLYVSGEDVPPTQPLDPRNDQIAKNPLWQQPTCTVAITSPATSLTGGFAGAEWSVFTLEINVPAHDEWVAFQLDSVDGCHDGACGESGAWIGTVLAVPLPTPELAITKTDGVTYVTPGDTLNYTISYRNSGDRTAENVKITDTLPIRSSFVSCTPAGSCAHNNGKVTFDLGPVPPGTGGEAHLVVRLDPIFPAGTTPITNRAVIGTTTPGDNPAHNQADDTDRVTAAVALAIAKSGPPVVTPGERITYTITSRVTGNAWAEHTTITDAVPAELYHVGCEPACESDGRIVTWNLGRITPDATIVVTLTGTVTSPLPNGHLIINITRIVADAAAPDSARFTSTVSSDHRLKIDKTSLQNPVFAGDPLTYAIAWEVTGNEPAPNVVITDVLPDNTTFKRIVPPCPYDSQSHTVTCRLDDLNPGASDEFSLAVTVTVVPPISMTNIAIMDDDDTSPVTTTFSHYASPISGLVWLDENGDGVPAAGERGIPSAPIILTAAGPAGDCTGPPLDDQYTSSAGAYRFEPLQSTRFAYCLDVDVTAALTPTQCLTPTTAPTMPIVLDPGGQSLQNSFGYRYNLATIAGTVFEDLDQDGAQNGNEGDLEGVRVWLFDPGNDHQCGTDDDRRLKRTRTNPAGWYEFTDLPFGDYCISIPIRQPELQGRKLTTPDSPTVPVRVEDCGQFIEQDFGYSGVYTVRVTTPLESPFVGTSARVEVTVSYPEPFSFFAHHQKTRVCREGVHPLFCADRWTDGNGRFAFSYDYAVPINDAGDDRITAWLDWDGNRILDAPPEPYGLGTVHWRPISLAVRYKCNCRPGDIDAVRRFTATIGNPAPPPATVLGVSVAFEVSGGTTVPVTAKTTAADGQAVFAYTSTAPSAFAMASSRLLGNWPSCTPGPPQRTPGARDVARVWVDLNRNRQLDGAPPDGEPACWYELVTAITLAAFTAELGGPGTVRVGWQTAVEIDSAGFNLHRAITSDGQYTRINPSLIAAVGGGGGASYSYVDAPPRPGAYFYKLEEVDVNGVSTFYGPVSVDLLTSWTRLYLPMILQ